MKKALNTIMSVLIAAAVGVSVNVGAAGQGVHGAAGSAKPKAVAPKAPRYGAIQMPQWSPDGAKLAFMYDIGGNAEVYTVNSDGTKLKNVSKQLGEDINPVWSPDGKTLMFSSFRKGDFDLCKTGPEGGKVDCLANKGDDLWPAWSPDGKTVAFCNYEKGSPRIYFMDPNGGSKKLIYDKPACHPAFSADGKRLALSSDGDIYVITLKNGKKKNITEPLIEGNMVDDTYPVWAPKGDRMAFIGQFEAFSAEVYTISGSGKKVRRITDNLFEDFLPNWEPKGKSVLYAGFVQGRQPEIFISEPESPLGKKRLTNNRMVEMSPRFSPDGKKIAYVVRQRNQDELYIMNADGSDPKPFLKDKLPAVEAFRKQRAGAATAQ
jgi:TolB protein